MGDGFKPLAPDEDGMTYMPVDRSRAAERPFAATDPRAGTPVGGIRLGKQFIFVLDDQMARLDPAMVATACDNIVRGTETYPSLLYLSRTRVEDAAALFAASRSDEVKVRWERLWVLSPYFARLARHEDGRAALLEAFADDLPGVHLISKFVEQNNPSVKKLLARLHAPLLAMLLAKLVEFSADPRRAALLSSIVGTLETKEAALRAALPATLDAAGADEILGYLYVRRGADAGGRLSSARLRDRLTGWRRE